ncbi:MAG: endonuclease III, partial [Thermodesulfovibrionales bacterium]|nr:endonuclease III [Thermodesulfovibrionales bacterium]
PSIVVDTHVKRISKRLGFTKEEDPVKIEFALREIIPEKYWTQFSLSTILHGREICKARKPLCNECMIAQYCNYFKNH